MASRGEEMTIGSPSRRTAAAKQAVDAEDGAGELAAPGADQAGDAEDLSAPDGEVDRLGRIGGGPHADHFETLAAGRLCRRQIERLEVATDHQANHGIVGDFTAIERTDHAAVAQHHDAVGAASHLVQPVGDEDDPDPVSLEPGDDIHESVGLGERQARGRLIHDDQTGIER